MWRDSYEGSLTPLNYFFPPTDFKYSLSSNLSSQAALKLKHWPLYFQVYNFLSTLYSVVQMILLPFRLLSLQYLILYFLPIQVSECLCS